MPSLGSHLAHSHGLAKRLGHPYIDADRGAFYMGATAPDMRVLMKVDRRHTHFYELDEFGKQDSVAAMFEAYPELSSAASLDPTTRAFMAGYLAHLLMDEIYIEQVYRVFFGEKSPLGGDLWANVLDRALQYEMNRRQLEDLDAMCRIRRAVQQVAGEPSVEFLPDELLAEWQAFSLRVASQEPNWDRFPRMMRAHLGRAGYSEEEIEDKVRDAPAIVAEAFDRVSEERVGRYLDEAAEIALQRLREYLAPA